MKIQRTKGGGVVWHLSEPEHRGLQKVFEAYPMIPAGYHRLSKRTATPAAHDGQEVLEDALAEQKRAAKQVLERLWNRRLLPSSVAAGFVLALKPAEVECLLQIVNELRVGNWIKLGSPGLSLEWKPPLSIDTAKHLHALEVCGEVEMQLLAALGSGDGK